MSSHRFDDKHECVAPKVEENDKKGKKDMKEKSNKEKGARAANSDKDEINAIRLEEKKEKKNKKKKTGESYKIFINQKFFKNYSAVVLQNKLQFPGKILVKVFKYVCTCTYIIKISYNKMKPKHKSPSGRL